MCDLIDHVTCQCRKHLLLVHQEGGFVACFPLNVLMIQSSRLITTADGKHLTHGGFNLSETICFGSLEFITNYFDSPRLSPKRNDSCAVFVGTAHNESPLLHTVMTTP
jgi:hypothetical protein